MSSHYIHGNFKVDLQTSTMTVAKILIWIARTQSMNKNLGDISRILLSILVQEHKILIHLFKPHLFW